MIPQVSPAELKRWLDEDPALFLLDVREPWEHEAANIGGLLAPVGEIATYADEIPEDRTVVVYCAHGVRSQIAIQRLQTKKPFKNLVNLTGGLAAFIE